jgi:two-component system, OmpR family, response regulator VicR
MPKILIAEDELSIATLLRDTFEDEGYAVMLAQNGQEALDLLSTTRPALVLTDIMMPVLDGLALCRAMQSNPIYQAIPVVVMSAIDGQPPYDGCHALGFLKKPFDLQKVIDTITNVIGLADQV